MKFAWLIAFGLLSSSNARADARADLERMLAAVGGREAWAAATNTRNEAMQYRLAEPNVVRAVIHLDFDAPRYRIDTFGDDFKIARAANGDAHWRITRTGEVEPISDATWAEDQRWYAAHVYRTIHRLAEGDAALSVRTVDGRLEVVEDDKRLAWFKLDSRGEPYAFGAHADNAGTLSGPWTVRAGGILHPSWTSAADGSFRAAIVDLKFNVELSDAMFDRTLGPGQTVAATSLTPPRLGHKSITDLP